VSPIVGVSPEDLAVIGEFLANRSAQELAIIFVDRVNSGAGPSPASEPYRAALAQKLVAEWLRLARDAVEGSGAGLLLATEGDSLLAIFGDAAGAVDAALRIHRDALRANRGRAEGEQLRLRAALEAISAGEPAPDAQAIGSALYRAGHLADAAASGQLLIARGAAGRLRVSPGVSAPGAPAANWRALGVVGSGSESTAEALWEVTVALPEPPADARRATRTGPQRRPARRPPWAWLRRSPAGGS
jgi:hypothetical protein